MIYPTRMAVLAAAAGAPVALVIGVLMPERWYAGLAWPLAVLLLAAVDAVTGARTATARIDAPATASVGETIDATVTVVLAGASPPRSVEIALAVGLVFETADDARAWVALRGGTGAVLVALTALRRGTGRIERVWLRWRGGWGLVWHQRSIATATRIVVLPDIRALKDKGAEIFRRHALEGLLTQVDRGDGTDFDALVEFRSGMDRRAIDWKQSARHRKLHAKEFRTERNNQIVFAIDSGRQMSEPVAGLPRVDRAVSAMLLTAWVALKLGDRVALHAFDSRPRIASGLVSGMPAFANLQRLAAEIDYSGEETNYTFALTTLGTRLTRRSMIVVFTEFTDLTSADFLVRAAMRIVKTHLLLVVVLRDEDVEAIADRAPATADDVTRAVTAAALLRDRRLVLARLEHVGVHVIEAEHDRVGERLVAGYVALKRRNLL
ncbi:DUF58 domain-containing protein [Sphingomonas sp. TREG-RG-20F-R18-01]|uniref:DUF58 domain-containing protein n=1 Tax=Sphingomonas sp. TREG-RG-20F-R18-01 TaxID=2914982 RepID=UPI001F5976CC